MGRLGSTKIASAKRSSTKLLSSQPDPAPSTGLALSRQKTSMGYSCIAMLSNLFNIFTSHGHKQTADRNSSREK